MTVNEEMLKTSSVDEDETKIRFSCEQLGSTRPVQRRPVMLVVLLTLLVASRSSNYRRFHRLHAHVPRCSPRRLPMTDAAAQLPAGRRQQCPASRYDDASRCRSGDMASDITSHRSVWRHLFLLYIKTRSVPISTNDMTLTV